MQVKRTISTQELKGRIGELVDAVRLRGDRYIVERRGKPVAALVPLAVNESYERDRHRLFDLIDEVHEQNRDVPPEKIDKAVTHSVAQARRSKRKQRKRV